MAETHRELPGNARATSRYAGYDRIMGSISWLLIALVSLDIKLLPPADTAISYLAFFCFLLLVYNVAARYLILPGRSGPHKTFADLMVFLFFTVAVCWLTGRATSPFISLLYLVLMATSLTQGKRVTYFMAALTVTSYVFLAAEHVSFHLYEHTAVAHVLELFPFMLIAHLGAMLSGEAESARREVERLSLTDEVTGLNNMRNFFIKADVIEALARRHGKPFALCMVDADNLKKVNDRYGHFAGTELIRHVARTIGARIRKSDILARYGGDEFVILFTECGKEEVTQAALRIVTEMAATPFSFEGSELSTTLSAGLAAYPEDGVDLNAVMARADEAMYRSKREGKNRLTVYRQEAS